jgi:iron-sulfur cluster insertion protein
MSVASLPVFRRSVGPDQINVTPSAREQLGALFAQADDDDIEAIRIYVAGGGCSGMSYGMTFTDRRTDYDRVLAGDGFQIYVDSVALGYLQGVEIDYVERETGATFVFNNVFQATGGSGVCGGCGAVAGGGCGS